MSPRGSKAAKKKTKASKKNLAGTVLAIFLATGAVNRYAFQTETQSLNLASKRDPANINRSFADRDYKWEKKMAEGLSSASARGLASASVGRAPSSLEKMRFGLLEEKYTITYSSDTQIVRAVSLQDAAARPAYLHNRSHFLNEYGHLLSEAYASSTLASVQTTEDKTVEAYDLFDKEHKVRAQAWFELDRHSRLLSLKVEPVQI